MEVGVGGVKGVVWWGLGVVEVLGGVKGGSRGGEGQGVGWWGSRGGRGLGWGGEGLGVVV